MAAGADDRTAIRPLLEAALVGDSAGLEAYLVAGSKLPGPRMNLGLIEACAVAIAAALRAPDPPVAAIEPLLDGWAALSLTAAPANDPREILPATAARSYGEVAIARPEWWADELAKLRRAARDGRWRTREMVATALQHMLAADWERTCAALRGWLTAADPLVVRAAAAAVAEPPLLMDAARGAQAVALQAGAVQWLGRVPAADRQAEDVRVLRQALGYTLSVAVAAAPEPGFALLDQLAATRDPDLLWVVRENLKKARLQRWADRVITIQARLGSQEGSNR